MTELFFLVDLIVNHKLPKLTRERILERIKEVEAAFAHRPMPLPYSVAAQSGPMDLPPQIAKQAPSTQAAMLRHMAETPASQPVVQIAQTPAAAAALAAREAMIQKAVSGKVDKGETAPPKAHA